MYCPDIIVREPCYDVMVVLLADVVCLNDCGKDREAIGRVQGAIVTVSVYPSQLLQAK